MRPQTSFSVQVATDVSQSLQPLYPEYTERKKHQMPIQASFHTFGWRIETKGSAVPLRKEVLQELAKANVELAEFQGPKPVKGPIFGGTLGYSCSPWEDKAKQGNMASRLGHHWVGAGKPLASESGGIWLMSHEEKWSSVVLGDCGEQAL
ncbi:hypothetical protein H920_13097 [Fukomys damarensis]|uniref:Uncharacterized protein n=1 Tax=Fukomys damarensis TaxID=885580 RepID=A0A091D0H9_FUKDA|nr:hypothetical protein H920_13097 [Fukomys damarensis]